MIFHFILNPKSGRSPKQVKLEKAIKDACIKRQLSYHIYYTTSGLGEFPLPITIAMYVKN